MDDTVTAGTDLATIQYQASGLLPAPMAQLKEIADFLSASGPMVAPQFRGKPDACLAIAYQAARWGLDPVAVAQKAYIVGGGDKALIGYEAQLIASLINTRAPMTRPLKITHAGEGAKRYCIVTGWLEGSTEPAVLTTPTLAQIKTKNSPLWHSDPDQQLAYYGQRAWARRFCPQVILGVYSPDEVAAFATIREVPADPLAEPDETGELPHVEAELVDDDGEVIETTPPPSGGQEAADTAAAGGRPVAEQDDLPEIRLWSAEQQRAILALTDDGQIEGAYNALKDEPRFKRLIAYDQPVAVAIRDSVKAHRAALKAKEG